MTEHSYSVDPWYVTEADGAIRVRQEGSDAVIATMDDGGHPEIELIPYADQLENAEIMAAAPMLAHALAAIKACYPKNSNAHKIAAQALTKAFNETA